jgi:hypothetical protein
LSRRLVFLSAFLAAACGHERLSSVDGALVVSSERLDFAPTWVGFPVSARFEVRNTGRVPRAAELKLDAPFSSSARVEVPGASAVEVEVRFTPLQGGDADSTLEVLSDGQTQVIALHASAQVPADCRAAQACHASSFDPVSGTCVDSLLPDDAPCSLESVCAVDARCRSGECRGVERSCDDANACTLDACEAQGGCLHVPVECPPSSDPCKVPSCDAASGCGLADAPDGTACGAADCVTAQVCMAGACKTVPVPNGFTCAGATPCQGKGVCQAQQCVQPAPAPMTPVWSYSVPQDHTLYFDGVSDVAGNLYWVECPTLGLCELVSATRDGFIRYRVGAFAPVNPWAPASGRGHLAIIDGDVVSAFDVSGVQRRRASDGSLVWSTPLGPVLAPFLKSPPTSVPARALVDDGQGGIALLAAPMWTMASEPPQFLLSLSSATGAVRWVRPFQRLDALAGDELGNLFTAGMARGDAGVWQPELRAHSAAGVEQWRTTTATWATALSVASGRMVESESTTALRRTANGAEVAAPDAGFNSVIATREAVLDATSGFQLFQPPYACCMYCSCPAQLPQLHLRNFTPASADVQWVVPVSASPYPTSSPPLVSEVLLTSQGDALYARSPNDIYAVTVHEERLEAVTPSGGLRFSCELPAPGLFDAIAYDGPAALLSDRWVIAARPVCYGCLKEPQPVIQAYDVPGYALAAKGWVAQRGNGQRSGRPR